MFPRNSRVRFIDFVMVFLRVDSSGQVRYAGDSSTTTGETQIPAKEWDFNSGTLRNLVPATDAIGRQGPADLCVQNALATMSMSTEPKANVGHYAEPIYAQIHKNSRTCSPSAFPVSVWRCVCG